MGFEWTRLGSSPGWVEGSSHEILMATPFACSEKRVKGTTVAKISPMPTRTLGAWDYVQQQQEMLMAPHSSSVLIQAKLWPPRSWKTNTHTWSYSRESCENERVFWVTPSPSQLSKFRAAIQLETFLFRKNMLWNNQKHKHYIKLNLIAFQFTAASEIDVFPIAILNPNFTVPMIQEVWQNFKSRPLFYRWSCSHSGTLVYGCGPSQAVRARKPGYFIWLVLHGNFSIS